MKILYSFNKTGFEADYWTREISAASSDQVRFVPFNHSPYLNPRRYIRAQLLDNLYYERNSGLLRLYGAFERALERERADAVIVDNCPPYHPDYLRGIPVYKVLRVADGPISAYDRDFAYCHAYDHVLYHSRAYSRDLTMPEKLRFVGVARFDFLPHCAFQALHDPSQTEATLFRHRRDLDIVFVGALFVNKMPLLAAVKRAFGRRFRLYGLCSVRRNIYWNLKHCFPSWVRPLPFPEYVRLYQRAKIGINVHNRGKYTVGGYRLFDLPANGVMQISDGGEYLEDFFRVGREIVGYESADELIGKIDHYLTHAEERQEIARNGFQRVMSCYRAQDVLRRAADLVKAGMAVSRGSLAAACIR